MTGDSTVAVMDTERLQREQELYQNWLDERIEEAYVVANESK